MCDPTGGLLASGDKGSSKRATLMNMMYDQPRRAEGGPQREAHLPYANAWTVTERDRSDKAESQIISEAKAFLVAEKASAVERFLQEHKALKAPQIAAHMVKGGFHTRPSLQYLTEDPYMTHS